MSEKYTRGNRFSPYMSLAEAAVEWHGLSPEQQELVVVDDEGIPYLACVPELSDRALALKQAVYHRAIKGLFCYGEEQHFLPPPDWQLQRDSAAAWIAATDARLAAPTPPVALPPAQEPERLLRESEVLDRLGIARPTLNRRRKAGSFPQPTHRNPNRWLLSVVDNHIKGTQPTISAVSAPVEEEEDI